MKKYFLSIVALASMLFATSCQESLVEPQVGGPTTFTIEVPTQMETKADFGSAENVNQLLVEVYQVGTNNVIYQTVKSISGSTKVELNLIQGQMYDILFWAQKENEYVQVDAEGAFSSLKSIELNSRNLNNDNGAAFFHAEKEFDDLGTSPTIYLRRPFAQLNLGTTDKSLEPMTGNVTLTGSLITVKGVATHFNVYEGVGYGNQNVEWVFGPEVSPKEPVEVPKQDLKIGKEPNVQTFVYVSMNYLAVLGDTKAVVDVDAKIIVNDPAINGERTIEHSFKSVPVQENYRTNIVGNLISSTTEFNVVVDEEWAGPDYNMLIWDGVSIEVPNYDDASQTYFISNGAQLAWLAATVSGDPLTRSGNTPNSLAGKTVKLTEDIYLGENDWKPIGMGGKHFEGIFDGQGHTIYGLKVASRYSGYQAALFCSAAGNAQFKDFTIDGAKIIYPKDGKDYYAAGVVGTIYGNLTFENITVKNSRITGNNKVAGLIAHDGTSSQITIKNCHILDSYIASEDLKDGGCVGGMIGYYATGVEGKENNISDSSVEGCTIVGVNSSNSGKRANSEFIGSILTKDAMVLNITDCILEGNTFTQTIDGIKPVTYQSLFIPQYIGGDREEQTKGKIAITIDGKAVIASGVVANEVENNEVITYAITSADGFEWISSQMGEMDGFEGKTILLTEDLDLTGVTTNGDSYAPIGSTGERDSQGRLVCEPFKGTFDGQEHTIKGIYQSGWDMGYEWGQYGSIGLFAELEGATVKNVVIDDMEAQVEGGDISFIAGSATGDCVFENITIKNSVIGTYNNGCGGIIGWSGEGNYTFKNITIGEDVVLGGLWGSFDSSIGGVVGQAEPGATYNFENVTINCRIDAYNDCTASYDYYNYRMCGMIIGRCAETTTINGANYPDLSKYNLSFNNVVVNYGDWMNYHYCRRSGERAVRIEPGYAYGGAENRDHTNDNLHCMEWIPFDQLIGGDQYAVKGLKTVEGVTVNYPESFYREQGYKAEGNTYTIYSGSGFKTIATTVLNDGKKNVTIELANDIDLAGIEWPAVSTAAAFVLDGKGYTIKNLTTSAVEDHGFYSTAMFTSTRKATTIKNLVVENATVTGKGGDNSHGAVLVACNYASLNIEGVTVKNSTVSNCDRSSVITTYLYFTTATVKNCVVEGCTVNSIGTAGALLGMNNSHNFEATGNTVKNTTISSSEGGNKAGILIGTWQNAGTLTESNNVVENSKAFNAGEETNNNIGRHA